MANVVNLRVHSFGNIEFLTRTPMAIKAGIGMDLVNFIWVSVLFAVLMYFIANFMIKKFNLATAGRNGNYDTETTDVVSNSNVDTANANSQVVQIINLLGGRDNIEDVDACMTRLRVSVKDVAQVGDERCLETSWCYGLNYQRFRCSSCLWTKSRCSQIRHSGFIRIWCCNSSYRSGFY